jgi:redox-sensitive bicupin YhaK (pirin superfamily)
MDVAPHPHIGLQTVSWLVAGEIVHKDSLGCEAVMRAGQMNLMTSGHGIAHSEETPKQHSGRLDGVQLWVALPEEHQHTSARFDHYSSLPVFNISSAQLTVITGELMQHRSPARTFSPVVGVEIAFPEASGIDLPLDARNEHALFVLHGGGALDGQPLAAQALHYLPAGRDEIRIDGSRDARLLLIGGEPFPRPVLMWWNFVASTQEELAAARQDWVDHRRFGEVTSYNGPRLPAPDMGVPAPPNPAS